MHAMSDLSTELRDTIGLLRICRAESNNALNLGLLQRLTAALQRLDQDPAVRCLLLLGNERAFATGPEPAELALLTSAEVQQQHPLARFDDLDRLRKPLVAAVAGYALGTGCELALAADLIVAAETARFGLSEVALGMLPGGGASQRLPRVVGRAMAADMLLTGRMLSAREALTAGLVSRVVPRENCEEEALKLCRELAARPPLAVQAAKEALRRAWDLPLSQGIAYERQLYAVLFGTDDLKEGLRAFLEKRPPIFVGR